MIAILGISAFYHDSAAALIVDGEIIAAAQEERFSRKKHDSSYPKHAIDYVLSKFNGNKVNYVVFYDKPFLKFERLLETYIATSPYGFASFKKAFPLWLKEKLFQKKLLKDKLSEIKLFKSDPPQIHFSEHHFSHAASAFYPSPFEEAVVLTIDGVGEWATSTISIGRGNNLEVIKEIHFPHSLGLLYSAFTYYIGFKVNSGEYKLMGLAPYGEPIYKDKILENLIDIKEDGSFRLDMSYFNYMTGLTMVNKKFEDLFGQPTRKNEEEEITKFHMDIASSIQIVLEEIIEKITSSIANQYKIKNLCLAGGVALNCVANGKILKSGKFNKIWVQPAAGDAGGALGAAVALWYSTLGKKRIFSNDKDSMHGSYLGPEYSTQEIENSLNLVGANFDKLGMSEIIEKTTDALIQGKAVGWFQGRMEFGPRALGNRSILADPRNSIMQKTLNLKIKYRESFRPFAPSILKDDVNEWFEMETESPYMLFVSNVKNTKILKKDETLKKSGFDRLNESLSLVPAITHVDYSARVQTVDKESNKYFHMLLEKFKEKTSCPILINTSFNVRGEPIVMSPKEAFKCFMGTELDVLVCGEFILYKKDQNTQTISDYKDLYELD